MTGFRYRCLVLDHDDTVVNSTATIHYPAFLEYMEKFHPENPAGRMSLEDYFRYNFHPGVLGLFTEICGLSAGEMEREEAYWKEYTSRRVPQAYPGFRELLEAHRARGGLITVVSHSFSDSIRRAYEANGLPMPDRVFGWEYPRELRKPSPWPLFRLMEEFDLRPEEMIVVDDLKPGYDMAQAAGVPFAGAGWANDIPEIESFMRENCDRYFKTVREFREFLES